MTEAPQLGANVETVVKSARSGDRIDLLLWTCGQASERNTATDRDAGVGELFGC
jgi:hypothetical protein